MPEDFVQLNSLSPDEDLSYTITNYLFHQPLYAFYVFVVERFLPDDIEGLLITPPFTAYGPFHSLTAATAALAEGLYRSA